MATGFLTARALLMARALLTAVFRTRANWVPLARSGATPPGTTGAIAGTQGGTVDGADGADGGADRCSGPSSTATSSPSCFGPTAITIRSGSTHSSYGMPYSGPVPITPMPTASPTTMFTETTDTATHTRATPKRVTSIAERQARHSTAASWRKPAAASRQA